MKIKDMKIQNTIQNSGTVMHFPDQNLKIKKGEQLKHRNIMNKILWIYGIECILYTRVLSACPLLGGSSSFGVSFIGRFTVMRALMLVINLCDLRCLKQAGINFHGIMYQNKSVVVTYNKIPGN